MHVHKLRNGGYANAKHMIKLMSKKILSFTLKNLFIFTYDLMVEQVYLYYVQ